MDVHTRSSKLMVTHLGRELNGPRRRKRKKRRLMDLRQIQEVAEEKATAAAAAAATTSSLAGGHRREEHQVDPSRALQSFLDHVPVSSIPSIHSNSQVVELKPDDCLLDAIRLLHDRNVLGAPIVDNASSASRRFGDREIGFIELSSMLLWSLEELDKLKVESKDNSHGFLSMLEQYSHIGQTKIGDLAKSFLWEPFFPVQFEDTLFHVLLLFSKHHRLKVVPVIKSSNSCVVGFITQNAVVTLLLQSSGLEWFDRIAKKPLSEFRFEDSSAFVSVYTDQTLADTFHNLWEKEADGVPVVDQKNGVLKGSVRRNDIYLLLEDDMLFNNRKSLTVEEFIKCDAGRTGPDLKQSTEEDVGLLRLKNHRLSRMNKLTVNRRTDSLKQAMENLVMSKSDLSFLVNKLGEPEGVVTLRDIISQFSPPSMDSTIDGGGFFKTALEQTGCHVKDGSIIRNA